MLWQLEERKINAARWRLVEPALLRVLHHSNYLELSEVLVWAEADGSAQWALGLEEILRKGFIDDCDLGRSRIVARSEVATEKDGNARGLEEMRSNGTKATVHVLSGLGRVSGNGNQIPPEASANEARL